MAQPDLTNIDAVKAWLSDPVTASKEDLLQDYITIASNMIREITGRRFTSPRETGVTRLYPTYDNPVVYIDEVFSEADLTSVTDETGLALTYEADWDMKGGITKGVEITLEPYYGSYGGISNLPPDHGELFVTELNAPYGSIRRYPKTVRVTGSFGYPIVNGLPAFPAEVQFAARQAVGVWFKEEVARYTADTFISRGQVFEPEALPAIAISKLRATGWLVPELEMAF